MDGLEGVVHGLGDSATVGQVVEHLRATYCSTVGAEFMHCATDEEAAWFAERLEQQPAPLSAETKLRVHKTMLFSHTLDNYLQKKFGFVKR